MSSGEDSDSISAESPLNTKRSMTIDDDFQANQEELAQIGSESDRVPVDEYEIDYTQKDLTREVSEEVPYKVKSTQHMNENNPMGLKKKGKSRIDTTQFITDEKKRLSVFGKKRATYLKYAEQLNTMCGSDTLSVCISGSAKKKNVRMIANGLLTGFEYSNLLEFIPEQYLNPSLAVNKEGLDLMSLLQQYMMKSQQLKQREMALDGSLGEHNISALQSHSAKKMSTSKHKKMKTKKGNTQSLQTEQRVTKKHQTIKRIKEENQNPVGADVSAVDSGSDLDSQVLGVIIPKKKQSSVSKQSSQRKVATTSPKVRQEGSTKESESEESGQDLYVSEKEHQKKRKRQSETETKKTKNEEKTKRKRGSALNRERPVEEEQAHKHKHKRKHKKDKSHKKSKKRSSHSDPNKGSTDISFLNQALGDLSDKTEKHTSLKRVDTMDRILTANN